jgi:hypothetical protein
LKAEPSKAWDFAYALMERSVQFLAQHHSVTLLKHMYTFLLM